MKKYIELENQLKEGKISGKEVLSKMVKDLEKLELKIIETHSAKILNYFYFNVICKPKNDANLLEIAKEIQSLGLAAFTIYNENDDDDEPQLILVNIDSQE
jgi:hypothetical protein